MKSKVSIVLLVVVILIICLFGSFWSSRNKAVELEERIKSQYSANKSEYDNMWKKFKEMAQIPEMQAEHYKELYMDLISGRYNDTNVIFKMIQEDNPKLDSDVYVQLQREISAGRDSFNNSQKKIADIIREYNTFIRKKVIMANITNRNVMNIDDFIVTSDKTEDAFNKGKDDEINFK